ncbi:MAG: DUF2948 family protein [Rubellimicrobium sp.]|nr:DUF2948 family protein [Rubellimicrobium sp.]
MTEDASFADGAMRALRLRALDGDDLAVISALAQDAVLSSADMRWEKGRRRFVLLLNRYRWEDADRAARARDHERVRSLLVIEDVTRVQSSGLPQGADDLVLSLLSLAWEPGEDGAGRVLLTFAGGGALALAVEALEVLLQDVTRPYADPARRAPGHDV